MRAHRFLSAVVGLILGMPGSVWSTEEHLLTVQQALAVTPEVPLGTVTYVTWFGGIEETTVEAVTWPSVVPSPHKAPPPEDLNVASVLGVGLRLDHRTPERPWRLVIDLTKLKPVPVSWKETRLDGEDGGRAFLLERVLEALEANFRMLGIFDCEVSVLGEKAHEDLRAWAVPERLNRLSEVWGPWRFPDLPLKYPEGDLRELAARSLTHTPTLQTIFLLVSGETFSPEAEIEKGRFLRRLLARTGDDAFAGMLESMETLVRKRICEGLFPADRSPESQGWLRWREGFPRTFGLRVTRDTVDGK